MPRFDRTGPRGLGPRTGRGAGLCPPGMGQEPTAADDFSAKVQKFMAEWGDTIKAVGSVLLIVKLLKGR